MSNKEREYDFNVYVYYQGEDWLVTADLWADGKTESGEDDSGRPYTDIEEEPTFYDMTIYDPDEETTSAFFERPDKYLEDNPDDELVKHALALLEEVYWERKEI